MKNIIKELLILFISILLFGCQTSQIKQKEIIYQIENDRVIKMILENDSIKQLTLREIKSTNQNRSKDNLIQTHSNDSAFFSQLSEVYISSDSADFLTVIEERKYALAVYIEDDILDPKYSQNLELGYSLMTYFDFTKKLNLESLLSIFDYYGLSTSLTDSGLSYKELLNDKSFRFNDVFEKGTIAEFNVN